METSQLTFKLQVAKLKSWISFLSAPNFDQLDQSQKT